MKFSKRPKPMDFAAVESEAEPALEPVRHEPVGFREDAISAEAQLARRPERPPADVEYEPVREAAFELSERPPSAWPTWLVAFAVAALWALAPIAFAVGYRSDVAPLQNDQFALTVFALLAIGPAIFVFGAAYLIRQGQKLAWEARRGKAMAEDMLAPALVAAARAGHVAEAVRDEIARAGAAAEEARETLLAMRDALAFETDRLSGATAQSVRTANELAATLGRERSEMSGLAQTLDAQAARVADSIAEQARLVTEATGQAEGRISAARAELAETLDAQAAKVTEVIAEQARMVTEATGLAETQIREAESTLQARAADLAAAAGEASTAARNAGEDLTRHIARLETAGIGVSEQVKAVEAGLSEQRAALVGLSQSLRADQQAFAGDAAAHAAKLAAYIDQTRVSATAMSAQASEGGEALRQLMSDAALQFRDLAETAKAEREEFGQSTFQSLEAVSSAAAEERAKLEAQTRAAIAALHAAAEETRAVAARHAATAREQVDHLSEAAFTAGQKANQVFEARLEEARALVEQSSKMVEQAGAATARKLDEGAAAARRSLDELAAMVSELEERAATLPATARVQAEQVRAAVVEGMDELMAQARRTAEQAEAIDAAFQDRVRRNFEMLSEAVRLMGTVAAAPAPLAAPTPPALSAPAQAAEEPSGKTSEPVEAGGPLEQQDTPAEASGAELAERMGLRPRIRLTPTATDRDFSAVFAAAPPTSEPPAGDDEGEEAGETWTWKDLLASLDGADGAGERLEETLGAELARMGVEPGRLLPQARVEEIAAVVQAGDLEGAREVVRKLAPAATRRIARRLFTDDDVKRRTEIYVRRYKTLIGDAMARDPEGFLLASLLDTESGRIFLLLDAAAGDMI